MDDLGRLGEDAAAALYLNGGYRVLTRNWRCGLGEIDLVAARGSVIVFCEVKARRGDAFGGPHEAVTWKKQHKLRQLAEAFLASRGLLDPRGRPMGDVRFDVASVTVGPNGRASVHLFEQAF